MKLMGRDISTNSVLAAVNERLLARGLTGVPGETEVTSEGVEARVDPMSFFVSALGDHANSARGLPLETHRGGAVGRAVRLAKRLFRSAGQIFINEALSRQVVFNGHVRDSYAQISAEVLRIKAQMAALEQQLAAKELLLQSAQNKVAAPAKAPAQAAARASVPAKPASKVRKVKRTSTRRSSKS